MKHEIPEFARREWLAQIMRGLVLCGLAGLAAPLFVRSWRNGCLTAKAPCGDCVLLSRCRLPQAMNTKKPR